MEPTLPGQTKALLAKQQILHQQQRKRLARRIHDDISQQLTLLSLQLSLAASDSKPPANWDQNCKQWSAMVLEMGQSLRSIINELQPRILDEFGLAGALQWFAHSGPKGIYCHLTLPGQPVALPPAAANEIFSVCRDIINEVYAPYGITEAEIVLEQARGVIRLHLRAHEKNPPLESLIVKAMDALSVHERLLCVDGSLELHQQPGEGLSVTLTMASGQSAASCAA